MTAIKNKNDAIGEIKRTQNKIKPISSRTSFVFDTNNLEAKLANLAKVSPGNKTNLKIFPLPPAPHPFRAVQLLFFLVATRYFSVRVGKNPSVFKDVALAT